jgi:large subunit ribosomal protein L22
MESISYFHNLKITPRKLRILLPEIKKMKPAAALDYLYYSSKRGADIYHKALKSAISNAKSVLKVSEDLLEFKLLTIEEGNKLKRYNPGARGTAKPYAKRFSHMKIILVAPEKIEKTKPLIKIRKKSTHGAKS